MKTILLLVAMLGGCAMQSGVVPIGPDTFMVSRQAATGFTGAGNLKAEALGEANAYCAKNNRSMMLVNSSEAVPPYIFGNFPRAEIQFMCLAAGDPQLQRPVMEPTPNVSVETRNR